MEQAPRKHPVLGVRISITSYDEVLSVCRTWIVLRRGWLNLGQRQALQSRYICITSVHGIMMARRNESIRRILNQADIATPDGMPIVWALRSFGHSEQQRVYGPTLMERLCADAQVTGYRVFLYGGRPESLPVLSERLMARYPALQLAGFFSPPFRALTREEDQQVKCMIRESDADLIFIGISTPKQEEFMWNHRSDFPGSVMIGVGAAFDFHAGRVKQAPSWMQRRGLEWLFRLAMEPRRLWTRYLLTTPAFLPLWALQKAGVLRYSDGR
jgi:N-acetylglucosaminyldiphosphoundecaprenol N-acetyl-beta-D-mannosaminyltransferase